MKIKFFIAFLFSLSFLNFLYSGELTTDEEDNLIYNGSIILDEANIFSYFEKLKANSTEVEKGLNVNKYVNPYDLMNYLNNDFYNKTKTNALIQELNTTINNLDFTDTNETLRVNELYNNISLYLQDEDTIYDDTELRDLIDSLNNYSGDYEELYNIPDFQVYNDTSLIETSLLDYYTSLQVDNLINELNSSIEEIIANSVLDTNETQRVEEILQEIDLLKNEDTSLLDLIHTLNSSLRDYYQKLEVDNLIQELNTTINNLDFTDTNETLRVNELYNNISLYLQDEDTIYDDTELRDLIQSLNNFSGSYTDLTNKPDLQIYNETNFIENLLLDYYSKTQTDNLINELNTTINNLDFTDTNETLRVNELYNNISQYLQDEDTIYDDTELRNLIQSLNSSLDNYNETNFIETQLLDYYQKLEVDNLIQELNTTINNLDFTDTNETLRVNELYNNISQYLQDENTIYDDTELRDLIQSLNNFSGSYEEIN